jgi:AGZA family xanthine/uracil permease-like MFS transporter
MVSRFFQLESRGTTPFREFQAGLTTFAAMAYILAVNPAILAHAGMDKGALVTVTAITAAVSTTLMALFTNFPIALAPGMGINAFFTYTICLGTGLPWNEALGMVFINGIIFLSLSVTGVREKIIASIPLGLKLAVTCGVGLFIAFIGLQNGRVIIANKETFVGPGDFTAAPTLLCLVGIVFTALLVARKVRGAIVIGILVITLAGLLARDGAGRVTDLSALATSSWLPHSAAPVFGKLTFHFLTSWTAFQTALPLIFTLLLVDMFDNIGTLIGVTKRAGLLDERGRLPKAGRALLADSIATILSALCGTSTVVSYIESAAGVEAGGRTGLTAIWVAILMLGALFLTPLILAIPQCATAPALVIVGIFMMQSVVEIDMNTFETAAPAVLTIFAIPLTFSIAKGIGIGLICSVLLSVGLGRARTVPPMGYAVAAMFFLSFFKIWPFH